MQAPLFCATCTNPLRFTVPELTGNRWYVYCETCGKATALAAILSEPEELATFSATGVYQLPMKV